MYNSSKRFTLVFALFNSVQTAHICHRELVEDGLPQIECRQPYKFKFIQSCSMIL